MFYRSLEEEIKNLELGLPPMEGDGFIGGRLDPEEASLVLIPVPWEATVSYGEGTALAPDAMRLSSHQLDVETFHYIKPYTAGIAMLDTDKSLLKLSNKARKKARKVIDALEKGKKSKKALNFVNEASSILNTSVYENDDDTSLIECFNSKTVEDPLDTITKKEYYKKVGTKIDEHLSDFEKQVLGRFVKRRKLCNNCRKT